jgi:CubicO group peptidase (beta-lactamase class C family)
VHELDVRSLLEDAAAEFAVPGAQLGLLHGDRRGVVCSGSIEAAGERPVVASTAFHAGSLAKAVTGLVVLDAARTGRLDLDTPCDEQARGLWTDTPRALLSQTSGRANLLPDDDEALEAFVARVASLPLVHPPGRFSYCNAGWSALDLLLRRTTGRSFEEAASGALGGHLRFGMPADAAAGHVAVPGQLPYQAPPTYAPAASAAGSRWWTTADQLLDFATENLTARDGVVGAEDLISIRTATAALPGATVFDSWGLGWAVWDRGAHQAFGWAGYTGGHRAFLRCFPDQDAAVVLLANSAGPLFGPPGGSAMFDALLPRLLEVLEVPPLAEPDYDAAPRATAELSGRYGPLEVEANGVDGVLLHAQALGQSRPVPCSRLGGNTFNAVGNPPGSTPIAFDGDLLYLGPFAMPRH